MEPPLMRGTCWPMFLLGTLAALSLQQCLVRGVAGLDIPASGTKQIGFIGTNVSSGEGTPATEAKAVQDSPVESIVEELSSSELEDIPTTQRLKHLRTLRLLLQRYRLRRQVDWVSRPGLVAIGSLLLGLATAALGYRHMEVNRRRKGILSTAARRGLHSTFTRLSSLGLSSRVAMFVAGLITAAVAIYLYFDLPFWTTHSHDAPDGVPAPVPEATEALASPPTGEPVKTVQRAKARRVPRTKQATRSSRTSLVELEQSWGHFPLRTLLDGIRNRYTVTTTNGVETSNIWQLMIDIRNLIGLLVGTAGVLWLPRVLRDAIRRRRQEEEPEFEYVPFVLPVPLEEPVEDPPPDTDEETW